MKPRQVRIRSNVTLLVIQQKAVASSLIWDVKSFVVAWHQFFRRVVEETFSVGQDVTLLLHPFAFLHPCLKSSSQGKRHPIEKPNDAMPITYRCTRLLLLFGYGIHLPGYLSSGLLTDRLWSDALGLAQSGSHQWWKCRGTSNPEERQILIDVWIESGDINTERCLNWGSIIDCNWIGRHQAGTFFIGIFHRARDMPTREDMQQQIRKHASQGHINASKLNRLQIIEHALNSFFSLFSLGVCVRIPVQTFEAIVFTRPRRTEQPSALPSSWDYWTWPIVPSMKLIR